MIILESEGHEFKTMDTDVIKTAEAEVNKSVLVLFRNANAVERSTATCTAREAIQAKNDLTAADS